MSTSETRPPAQAALAKLRQKMNISDEELYALQRHIDELEIRAADSHHDHDHPTVESLVSAVRPGERAPKG
jgi:hypothetical protein